MSQKTNKVELTPQIFDDDKNIRPSSSSKLSFAEGDISLFLVNKKVKKSGSIVCIVNIKMGLFVCVRNRKSMGEKRTLFRKGFSI